MKQDDKEYTCSYKYCLHHGEGVKGSEAVVINKKYYHWDCALEKQQVQDCVNTYMNYTSDKSKYPVVSRIINTLVHKNKVPIEFITNNIKSGENYYKDRSEMALYGIRKLYWEYWNR